MYEYNKKLCIVNVVRIKRAALMYTIFHLQRCQLQTNLSSVAVGEGLLTSATLTTISGTTAVSPIRARSAGATSHLNPTLKVTSSSCTRQPNWKERGAPNPEIKWNCEVYTVNNTSGSSLRFTNGGKPFSRRTSPTAQILLLRNSVVALRINEFNAH